MTERQLHATSGGGVVASGHPLEVAQAVRILEEGGNAIDAVVCAALIGCVVEHRANGLGGYGTIVTMYLADRNEVICVDANGMASELATPDMYERDEGTEGAGGWDFPIKGRANFNGPRSVSVPGTVAGLGTMLDRFGTRKWADMVQPAERLAREGFPMTPMMAAGLIQWRDLMTSYPGTFATFYPNGEPVKEGETFVQKDLADTFRVLARDGWRALYEGEIAHKISKYITEAGGLMTEADLADYQPLVTKPVRTKYRDIEVCSSPMPTGGPTVAEILRILDNFELPPLSSPEYYRLLSEVMVRAWRDRLEYFGDPSFVSVDMDYLLSDQNIDQFVREIREAVKPEAGKNQGAPGGTTHFVTADKWGNVVALTQTHGGGYGSKVVVPGLGIVLAHGMSRFDPVPGRANSVGPRKRPLHNMGPTIMLKDGKGWGSIGTPGGRAVMSCVVQVISHMVDRGMNIAEAIDAPRIHREAGVRVVLEQSLFDQFGTTLESYGYEPCAGYAAGPAHGVQRMENGEWMAATDRRGIGSAGGV